MRFEHFKDLFYKELERKEHVNNRYNWTVGVFIVLIGANVFCLNLLFELQSVEWAMILLYGCTTVAMLVAAVLLAIPMWVKKGMALPTATEQNSYFATLETHYASSSEKEKEVNEAFTNYLVGTYVQCTDATIKGSDSKLKMTALGSTAMLISLVFLLLTFVVVAPEKANQDDVIKVEVIEGGDTDAGK